MKKQILNLLCLFCITQSFNAFAQNQAPPFESKGGEYYLNSNNSIYPCISQKEYDEIDKECAKNIKMLGLPFKKQKGEMLTLLNWPLKAAPGFDDCSFYVITAHVDQDFSAGNIKDYYCGSNTYDGHKGTDIATYPFGIYKIDHDQVQVIAAAPGTIIAKIDGNFDKNCASNNLAANYIAIQHADGSTALYFHMKKNSLTSKAIGATIAVGEFLGIVGSSGNSTGPHCHFEVWSGSTSATYLDPFSGSCNLLNSSSWWASQKPYTEPEIIKASVNTTDIVIPGCPATEIPNESSCYSIPFQGSGLPAGYAKFYIFFRNETQGMIANMSILNPDGTTFASWVYTSTTNYNASYRTWSKTLPAIGGTYTFKATYNGISCEKKFDIVKAVITPDGSTSICQGTSVNLQASTAKTYLWSTGDTTQIINVSNPGDYKVTITNIYGCTSTSDVVNIKVNPKPVATITPDGPTSFCEGGSVKLNSNAASSYLWSTGETSQNINVNNSGDYKLTVTNNFGCTATSSPITVTVNLNPIVNITPNGPTSFCEGGKLKLSSSLASNYHWSTGDTTQNIFVSTTGEYKITVTSSFGCSTISTPISIKVNPNPVASIGPDGPVSFCQGGSVKLSSAPASSYLWNTGATSQSINVNNSGIYSLTITDQNLCNGTASIQVTVNAPKNNLTIIVKNDSLISPYGPPGKWYLAGNPNLIGTGITIKCNKTGIYYVTGTDINGCIATSDTISLKCNATAVNNINSVLKLNVYPNPFESILHISGDEVDHGIYHFSILNILGQLQIQKDIIIDSNNFDLDLNLNYLPDGFYILAISKGNALNFIKLVKGKR